MLSPVCVCALCAFCVCERTLFVCSLYVHVLCLCELVFFPAAVLLLHHFAVCKHGHPDVCVHQLLDTPLYYSITSLCSVIHCRAPSTNEFIAGLASAGYRASQSHVKPDFVKTDAPPKAVWDLFR